MSMKAAAAQLYLKNSDLQKDHAAELMSMLNVPYGGLVLDLGCGTGHLATILSDLVGSEGKVVAVDPDAQRIAVAKRENSQPNIEYIVANDETFPGEGYNLIVSTHVIHWIKNKQALFHRLYNKLAPGGIFGFVTYNSALKLSSTVSEALNILISPDFENDFLARMVFENEATYEILSTTAGLNVLRSKVVLKDLQFSSVENFLEFFSGASHGGFSISDVDTTKLQNFKKLHKNDLALDATHLDTLCMVVGKFNQ